MISATISEMIRYKYSTMAGMKEMRGLMAVNALINAMGRYRYLAFKQAKKERDKRVMAMITRPVVKTISIRDRLIQDGLLQPYEGEG